MSEKHADDSRAEPVPEAESARHRAEREFLLARDAYYRAGGARGPMRISGPLDRLTTPDPTDIVRAT